MSDIKNKIAWLIEHREGRVKKRFADRIGIKSGHLHDWITGKSVPKYENQKRIADAYGVSIDWLNSEVDISPTEFDRVTHKEQQEPHQTTNTREPAQNYHTEQAPASQSDINRLITIVEHSQDHYDRLIALTERQAETIDKLADVLQNATKPPCHDHENKTPPTKAPPGKTPGVVRLHRKKTRNI